MKTITATKQTAETTTAKIAESQIVETQNNGLTPEQRAKMLLECEATIEKGQSAFFATAYAVKKIRDKGLFAPEFENITAYCVTKWDFTPSDVSRFTNAADVLETLKSYKVSQLPTMEGHTRALAELSEGSGKNRKFDKCVPVWVAALNSGKKITGALIRELANPKVEQKEDVKAVSTVESVAQNKPAETDKKISATVTIETTADILDVIEVLQFDGVSATVTETGAELPISADDKAGIFAKLASWSKVNLIKKITVSFD